MKRNNVDIFRLDFKDEILLYSDPTALAKSLNYSKLISRLLKSSWGRDDCYLFYNTEYITDINAGDFVCSNWYLCKSKHIEFSETLKAKLLFIDKCSHDIGVYLVFSSLQHPKDIFIDAIGERNTLINKINIFSSDLVNENEFRWMKSLVQEGGVILSKSHEGTGIVFYGYEENIKLFLPEWYILRESWSKFNEGVDR